MNIESLYNIIGKRVQNMIEGFFGEGTSEGSFNDRQLMIKAGLEYFSKKPLLGHGLNNFKVLFGEDYGIETYAHNNFIELIVCVGLAGFISYYVAYFYILGNLLKASFIKKDRLSIIAFILNLCFLIMHYGYVGYYDVINTLILLLGFLVIRLNKGVLNEKDNKKAL